ncbi:unnamed protein product [Ixodes persulcatus]
MREHNRIASKLASLNPPWDDEKLFQESRRIVGTEVQHISFREFLPAVLGESVAQIFGLKLASSGYYRGYDPAESSDISNVFAAAAFRFGHSMVPRSFHRHPAPLGVLQPDGTLQARRR